MQRRQFIASSLAASAVALNRSAAAQEAARPREFYLLRQYRLQSGPQTKLTESYFSDALLPALARLGMGPVGALRLELGPETPAFYLLVPGKSADALATLDLLLAQDAVFLKAAEPFWNAPATAAAFLRVESSLLWAFEGWPRLVLPPASATKGSRIFQLRTYESPSLAAHVRKVEMFNRGEFDIFEQAGFHSVFFADMLIGPRMPCLTYMLSAENQAELDKSWENFRTSAAWKKLSSSPRYSYEEIVSSITNYILSPLGMSQI